MDEYNFSQPLLLVRTGGKYMYDKIWDGLKIRLTLGYDKRIWRLNRQLAVSLQFKWKQWVLFICYHHLKWKYTHQKREIRCSVHLIEVIVIDAPDADQQLLTTAGCENSSSENTDRKFLWKMIWVKIIPFWWKTLEFFGFQVWISLTRALQQIFQDVKLATRSFALRAKARIG